MDREQKTIFIAIFLSLLFHAGLLWIIENNQWLLVKIKPASESIPQEITFTFPENRPKEPREVVQNLNENEEVPEQSNLLSDRNSRARNPERTDKTGKTPLSAGNSPFSNLSGKASQKTFRSFKKRSFSREALAGESYRKPRQREMDKEEAAQAQKSNGSNQMLQQNKFSVEELGAITLSTYKWQWAPYINSMKNKLERVWTVPPAYYRLGLVHGYTIILFTIDRGGNLIRMKVLKHSGHISLETSSTGAIKSLFPFLPLPDDFPDETLTITAKLYYPDLRSGR